MSGKTEKRLRRVVAKASRLALQETPAWTFVEKIIRPKPVWMPDLIWWLILRWMFPVGRNQTLVRRSPS